MANQSIAPALLTVMIAMLACAFSFAEPDLLAKSRYVWTPPAKTLPSETIADGHVWLDSNHLLYLTPSRGDPRQPQRFLLDLASGKTTTLDGLTKCVHEQGLEGLPQPNRDGTRLLWYAIHDRQIRWCITDLQGSLKGPWKCRADLAPMDAIDAYRSYVHWSADGESVTESELQDAPQRITVWRRPLRDLAHESASVAFLTQGQASEWWCDAYDVGGGHLFAIPSAMTINGENRKLEIFLWKSGGREAIRTIPVRLPPPYTVGSGGISPDRRRILWDLVGESGAAESLWTSDLEGSEFREVGRVVYPAAQPDLNREHFGDVQWIPGRAAISYVLMGKLYKVDAPG